MERTAVCAICGRNIARFTCMKCGASVCENCFTQEKQVCRRCLHVIEGAAKKQA
ncbi:MAG TPA: orotate phosphoribosyltransferase [Nanoarchaeota archaeon]|nr:orotate phosphoribosyltransferase [Nanoarchaeota archaeon]